MVGEHTLIHALTHTCAHTHTPGVLVNPSFCNVRMSTVFAHILYLLGGGVSWLLMLLVITTVALRTTGYFALVFLCTYLSILVTHLGYKCWMYMYTVAVLTCMPLSSRDAVGLLFNTRKALLSSWLCIRQWLFRHPKELSPPCSDLTLHAENVCVAHSRIIMVAPM